MRRGGVPVCALERPGRCPLRVELARPHLLYAKWLRRENRPLDARAQLRIANDENTSIGMQAFAERARRELLATGETVRKRSADTRDDLTPQQRQIAELADDGLSVRTQKRWRWDDRPRSGPRGGALPVRRQSTRAPYAPHPPDLQRRRRHDRYLAIAVGALLLAFIARRVMRMRRARTTEPTPGT